MDSDPGSWVSCIKKFLTVCIMCFLKTVNYFWNSGNRKKMQRIQIKTILLLSGLKYVQAFSFCSYQRATFLMTVSDPNFHENQSPKSHYVDTISQLNLSLLRNHLN